VEYLKNRKFYCLLLVIFLITGLTIFGCGKSEQTGEAGGKGEVLSLTFATAFPITHDQQRGVLDPWIKEIEEKSQGRIKIEVHPSGSLSEAGAIVDDVASGAVDLGWTMQGYTPGRFPLTSLVEFPAHYDSAEEVTRVLMTLLEKNEAFQEEYKNYKVLAIFGCPPGNAYTVNKPVRNYQDLKGLHLRTSSSTQDKVLTALGGNSANMPFTEVYDAVDRGVIDGFLSDHTVFATYDLADIVKYATDGMNFYVTPHVVYMSLRTWNKLSPEDQKIFEESSIGMEMAVKAARIYDQELISAGLQKMKEAGIEIYQWTDADKQAFYDITYPILDKYIAEFEAKGLPAQKVYDEMLRIRDELRK
jgi:TRAP-type C4-dicarboxylate transport system substrate-binding protein